MNKFQVLVKSDPYAFLSDLREKDKSSHGTVLARTYPGGILMVNTNLSKTDVEFISGVKYVQNATY